MAKGAGSTADLDSLPALVASIFEQTEISTTNHHKNAVALYKLHIQASKVTQPTKNGKSLRMVGEKVFGDVFIDMINRVLVVKKGVPAAERVVKYVGSYVRYVNEKVMEEKVKRAPVASTSAASSDEEDDDSLASRFVARLLKWLTQGFVAKQKNVRFRAVHIVSEMISHLGELEEDAYNSLRNSLVDRVNDKEPSIRANALIALSKLAGSEDPSELQEGQQSILDVLLDALCFDTTPEVRRAALIHTPLTPSTLPIILTRTRDTDAVTRKLFYTSVLARLDHPRQLTIEQREHIIKDGLGDREPGVRVAAGKSVAGWFDALTKNEEYLSSSPDGLISFLTIFDVVGPGESVAVDALLSLFVTRPEVLDKMVFTDSYWKGLTPESALLARVFTEHCTKSGSDARLEAASLPVITAFAFYVQDSYNTLLEIMELRDVHVDETEEDEEEKDKLEEELSHAEVVLAQLLRIVLKLDYADEIGRRKVFVVVRDMLAQEHLPESLIEHCVDVLKQIMPSEAELIRVVVEIVGGLRDLEDEDVQNSAIDDSRSDSGVQRPKPVKTPEDEMRADLIDHRCLLLCIALLERVDANYDDHSTLKGVLGDLIIPAVKRKQLILREKGLICLGLCCLISKELAMNSLQLFLTQIQSSPEHLRVKILQLVFDLLILYEDTIVGRSPDTLNQIVTFLLQTLENEESHLVQAVLCIGISKLLLAGIVTDARVLTSLVLVYISSETADNLELRQCLAYFFPVYCYSSLANQRRMRSIFITAYERVTQAFTQLDEDDQGMISPAQFCALMADWTDSEKSADATVSTSVNVHGELAIDVLQALYDSDLSDADQKVLCGLLGQLNLTLDLEERSILKLNLLLTNIDDQRPFDDNPTSSKAMARFKARFNALFSDQVGTIDPLDFLDDEFKELYDFMGISLPKRLDGQAPKKRSQRMQEEQEASEAEEELNSKLPTPDAEPQPASLPKRLDGQAPKKRSQRMQEEQEASEAEEELNSKLPTPDVEPQPSSPVADESALPASSEDEDDAAIVESHSDDAAVSAEGLPLETPTPINAKPVKGTKRHRTPTAVPQSPLQRKRTRAKKSPEKPQEPETIESANESEGSEGTPTPVKAPPKKKAAAKSRKPPAVRQPAAPAAARNTRAKSKAATKAVAEPAETGVDPSSDDMGGY